ncbi:hypothetical protein ACA910_018619 [Epithemia clementina (nom. ined.)]
MDAFDHHLIKGPTNAFILNHIKLRSWGAGIGNMHYQSLAHFNKSDDPNANQLFDGGPTVPQILVIDMAKHQIGDPWHETPHQFILLLQEHSSVHQSDIQGQDNYDYFTSHEAVEVHSVKPPSQYHNENVVPCYSVMKNTAIGYSMSITVLNDQIQRHKNYGKDHWTTGTIVILTYLIIALVAHGHLTEDHSYITIFQAELWGAVIDYTITTLSKSFFTRTVAAQDTEFHIFPTYFGVLIRFLLLAFHNFAEQLLPNGLRSVG